MHVGERIAFEGGPAQLRTPGGWGAEKFRSLGQAGPFEAMLRFCQFNAAGAGPKKGGIKEFSDATFTES